MNAVNPLDCAGIPSSGQARHFVFSCLAQGLAPDPIVKPSEWAAANLIVADGPHAGFRWSPELTPYMVEIVDQLSIDSPHTKITVRKSAQTGFTEAAIGWLGTIIDKTPGKAMAVFPTIASAQDFNREKLAPTIEQTPALRRKIIDQKSRSTKSSTAQSKKFPKGSLTLTGANSPADLRSKTIKYMLCDEIDEFPQDLEGQGDPMGMIDARQISFHGTGDYKKLQGSTPTSKGMSRIDDEFEKGDQRYYHVSCPHCDEEQVLVFGGKDASHGLKFNTSYPYEAKYACEGCGVLIEHREKRAMILGGRWIAMEPGAGKHPSYHIDALSSLLTTWDHIVEQFLDSKDDPKKLKAFTNLTLGEAWEERGDAPEWQGIYTRREDYQQRTVPHGGVVLTMAVDVQSDGLYYEVLAWGKNMENWSIDVGFLDGDTGDQGNKVWRDLDVVFNRVYPTQSGHGLKITLAGADSGFNTQAVYNWTKRYPNALALKGADGWGRSSIGTAQQTTVGAAGKKVKKRGVKVWLIGTWSLKSQFYSHLRLRGIAEGEGENPRYYAHFATFHDEGYFKQITSETLKEFKRKGRMIKEYDAGGRANHYLDCRIYNLALAEHVSLNLANLTDDEWNYLISERLGVQEAQSDMDQLWNSPVSSQQAKPKDNTDNILPEKKPPRSNPSSGSLRGGGLRGGSLRKR